MQRQILSIEDITELTHTVKAGVEEKQQMPQAPKELTCDVNPAIAKTLDIS